MKILKSLLLAGLVGSVLSCTPKKSEEAAGSCSFASTGLARVSSYGTFDPNTLDQCEQFNGSTSYWTGMDVTTSSTALVAPPTGFFNGGMACGSCLQVTGASATVIARVVAECSGCPSDVLDMDEDHYREVTGFPNSGSGFGNITVTAIPCPSTENIKAVMNTGTNPFYLNMVFANHVTPIKKVEVDPGTGYQELVRQGTTGAFALSFNPMVSGTAQVRLTDIFNQIVTGTFDTPNGTSTVLNSQFGTCN